MDICPASLEASRKARNPAFRDFVQTRRAQDHGGLVDGIEVYSVAIGRQQGRVCAVVDYHTGDKSMSDAINREADIRTLMAQTGMSRTEAAFVLAIESGEIAGDIIELGVSDEAPETVARPGQQRTERHDLDND